MRSLVLSLLISLCGLSVSAQLIDRFDDGDFTTNPSWQGNADQFAVVDQQLQLQDNAPESNNERYLSLVAPTSRAANTTWEVTVRLDFAPSSSNFARIYLAASQPDLTQALNGYYLQVGGITGSDDAVELFRQDGTNRTRLLSGQVGAVGSDPAQARLRVTRTTDGTWTLFADYSGQPDGPFTDEGQAMDATYDQLDFFGVYARYTSTRGSAFTFDDVFIDPIVQDDQAPELQDIQAVAADLIALRFDETVEPETGTFTIDGTIQPSEIIGVDARNLSLRLAAPLVGFQTYELRIDGLEDAFGNALDTVAFFEYIPSRAPEAGDVIVTEFMADPNPVVGLPDAEFAELYNTTQEAIQLGGLQFSSGGSPQILPDFLLLPGAYAIVTDMDDAASFEPFGAVIGLESFPSLSNSGDVITLGNANGQLLFEITYTDDWYANPDRDDGGFSIEFTDLGPPFQCPGRWGASTSSDGGTPGTTNLLLGVILDETPPQLLSAVFSESELLLTFDDPLDTFDLSVDRFELTPDLVIQNLAIEQAGRELRFNLSASPQEGVLYTLRTTGTLMDCAGNSTTEPLELQLGLPEEPQAGEVVINELLFNPLSGGVDYVELFNRSEKIFDLAGWNLRNTLQAGGNNQQRIESSRLLLPGGYLVLTPDPMLIQQQFPDAVAALLVEQDLPTLADREGNVSVFSAAGVLLDSVTYTSDWHIDLLRTQDGVSLERISPEAPSQSAGSWTSAASTVGFGTPTLPNSQLRTEVGQTPPDQLFRLVQETFSPDGDGFEDVLLIEYQTPAPEYVVRVRIFDAQGRPVREFPQLELLEGQGQFTWDGATDSGELARMGLYVIQLEAFTPSGTTQEEQLVAVLAARLN